MGLLVLPAVAMVLLLAAAIWMRRAIRAQAKLDRHGLDGLRRIYRQDNPRGPGLEPLIQDLSGKIIDPRPLDSPE